MPWGSRCGSNFEDMWRYGRWVLQFRTVGTAMLNTFNGPSHIRGRSLGRKHTGLTPAGHFAVLLRGSQPLNANGASLVEEARVKVSVLQLVPAEARQLGERGERGEANVKQLRAPPYQPTLEQLRTRNIILSSRVPGLFPSFLPLRRR